MKTVLDKCVDYSDDKGNSLEVGGEVSSSKLVLVFHETGSTVTIGKNVKLDHCKIELGKNSRLVIGDGSQVRGLISVGYGSSVVIGKDLKVVANLKLRAVEGTNVSIGDDCLFATDVTIRTNDGHPIYDAVTKERINLSKPVTIGDHVWLGEGALILKGVDIGESSVIAGGSIVTKDVPKNSVAAGSPARVVRSGVVWEHNTKTHSPKYYSDWAGKALAVLVSLLALEDVAMMFI